MNRDNRSWQDFEPQTTPASSLARPFQVDVLEVELLAERLIRKHILVQYVDVRHPVLAAEERLVVDSKLSVSDHIQDLVRRGYAEKLARMAVCKRLIESIRVIIGLHDIDDDCAEVTVQGAEAEAMGLAQMPDCAS